MKKNFPDIVKCGIAFILSVILGFPVFGQPPSSPPKPSKAEYPLTIDGTATIVGKWLCGGNASVQTKPSSSLDPVPGLGVGVQTVVVTASIPEIDCGDSGMNKHLRKALKDKKHPEIRYQALSYTLIDNGTAVQTSGELTIAGRTRPVEVGAKLIALPEGGTRVVGNVQINMRDYGVKPPSVFFGALRVADMVTVRFDTTVTLPQGTIPGFVSR